MLLELCKEWPAALQVTASRYLQDHDIDPRHMLRTDVVLMLLRINTAEALGRAQELAGKSITKCPSAVPPWPPLAPVMPPRAPRVAAVAPNPCLPATDMARRYDLVKKGMTKAQLLSRGVQPRDLRIWLNAGHVSFTA